MSEKSATLLFAQRPVDNVEQKHNNDVAVDRSHVWRENRHRWWWLCLGLMGLAVMAQLLVPLVRMRFRFSIDYPSQSAFCSH